MDVKATHKRKLDLTKIQDGDTDRETVGTTCSEPPPLGTPRERGINFQLIQFSLLSMSSIFDN